MPEFNVGIAVNRRSRAWIEFVDDALERYLREDEQRIIELLVGLNNDTASSLRKYAPLNNRAYARFDPLQLANRFLCLPPERSDPLDPWGLEPRGLKQWERIVRKAAEAKKAVTSDPLMS